MHLNEKEWLWICYASNYDAHAKLTTVTSLQRYNLENLSSGFDIKSEILLETYLAVSTADTARLIWPKTTLPAEENESIVSMY